MFDGGRVTQYLSFLTFNMGAIPLPAERDIVKLNSLMFVKYFEITEETVPFKCRELISFETGVQLKASS